MELTLTSGHIPAGNIPTADEALRIPLPGPGPQELVALLQGVCEPLVGVPQRPVLASQALQLSAGRRDLRDRVGLRTRNANGLAVGAAFGVRVALHLAALEKRRAVSFL